MFLACGNQIQVSPRRRHLVLLVMTVPLGAVIRPAALKNQRLYQPAVEIINSGLDFIRFEIRFKGNSPLLLIRCSRGKSLPVGLNMSQWSLDRT